MTEFKPVITGFLATCTTIFLASCGGGGGGGAPVTPGPVGTVNEWLIPSTEVVDGGPGQDGIPAIDAPLFQSVSNPDNDYIFNNDLVTGIVVDGEYRAYPHKILNWHEVVNDSVGSDVFVLSHCPLTGSSLAWDVEDSSTNPEFGVSGLLYNSNLILYDRRTDSRWSQMLEQSVWGSRSGESPARIQVIETTWTTWQSMYPNSQVLTRDTGFYSNADYFIYPYGEYRWNDQLLFPVSNDDNRLHKKDRVIGIRSDTSAKVYQLDGFGDLTQTINEQFEGTPIVVVGNTVLNFAAIFDRELGDGTLLTFSPLAGQLPGVMEDNEGNVWDVFGTAISGPRMGTQLDSTNSYIAMWFAWATFFENTEIHFN